MDNNNLLIGAGIVILIALAGVGILFLSNQNAAEPNSQNSGSPETNITSEKEDQMDNMKNIVQTAIDTPDLSTLVAAVQAANLEDALADESKQYTVFAPTNDAFAAIQSTVDQLLADEDKSALSNVLLFHVVEGKVMSGDLSDGMTVTALNGDTLTINIEGGKAMVNGAEVVIADVETSNGVVHVINTVLIPE